MAWWNEEIKKLLVWHRNFTVETILGAFADDIVPRANIKKMQYLGVEIEVHKK